MPCWWTCRSSSTSWTTFPSFLASASWSSSPSSSYRSCSRRGLTSYEPSPRSAMGQPGRDRRPDVFLFLEADMNMSLRLRGILLVGLLCLAVVAGLFGQDILVYAGLMYGPDDYVDAPVTRCDIDACESIYTLHTRGGGPTNADFDLRIPVFKGSGFKKIELALFKNQSVTTHRPIYTTKEGTLWQTGEPETRSVITAYEPVETWQDTIGTRPLDLAAWEPFPMGRSPYFAALQAALQRPDETNYVRVRAYWQTGFGRQEADNIITLRGHEYVEYAPFLSGYNFRQELNLTETDGINRSEEHTSELQSQSNLVCRLL